jgi:hypothetical protein
MARDIFWQTIYGFLRQLLADITKEPRQDIGAFTKLSDLGISSKAARDALGQEINREFDKQFGIKLKLKSGDLYPPIQTVKDVAEVVRAKIPQGRLGD